MTTETTEATEEQAPGPGPRYYGALVAAWEGRLAFAMTDWGALRAAAIPLGAKLAWMAMGVVSRVLGDLRMATTLSRGANGEWSHTTLVSKWGIVALETEERITLAPDGRSLVMKGEMRAWPRLGAPERYDSDGEIDESATRATYRVPMLGAPLVQRTRIVPEGLELSQETPWSRSKVLLRRR